MTPTEEYSSRLREREQRLRNCDRLHERIGAARLALAGAFLVIAWGCVVRHAWSALWLLIPGAVFIALVLHHQRVRNARALARRAVAFYQGGLERLEGKWRGRGLSGDRFNDEHHLYGGDLDLFGKRSLYELLCTARTPMGESTLARWLLAPADQATILQRQACVAALRDRLQLREDLSVFGEPQRIALQAESLVAWADAATELSQPWLPVTVYGLAAAAGATALLWAMGGIAFPFFAVLALEAGLNYALRNRVQAAVAGVETAYDELKLLSVLLARIEAEPFDEPPLQALRIALRSQSLPASSTLSRLATIVNFVEARRNPFLTPLLLPLLYTIQSAPAAGRWRRRHGAVVASWLRVLGEIEALMSMAGYAYERPEDVFPEFLEGPAAFRAAGLAHPLISPPLRVRNDVGLSGATRVLLVSGSNMSGKSTLLRSVGMNTVLAMAGAPVCATRLQLTPLQVGASIRVNDSLFEGSSRFYAEITRLRQLFAQRELPLLFLLDELLQGTNSTDRRIGAHGVIRALLERGAIGLVSTHDLALTDSAGLSPGALANVYFQDDIQDGTLRFDFKLRDGVASKSNGIELMRAIGLDV